MNLQLEPVKESEQWHDYHDLRRVVLFESRGRIGVYDENHPDENAPGNHPMLFYKDGAAVGAVRIDLNPEEQTATFRRVAIREDQQRHGLGRSLMGQAESFAALHRCTFFVANVARDAVGFYEKLGYRYDSGSPENHPYNPRMIKGAKGS